MSFDRHLIQIFCNEKPQFFKEIPYFCKLIGKFRLMENANDKKYRAIDFFCGGGGMTCGLRQAGIDVIAPRGDKPIFECWEGYEKELVKLDIPGRTPPPLTTPAKKTKIYGYLESLLGESKSQKELIKEPNRDYENPQHWNLDAEYLGALKGFINTCLIEK